MDLDFSLLGTWEFLFFGEEVCLEQRYSQHPPLLVKLGTLLIKFFLPSKSSWYSYTWWPVPGSQPAGLQEFIFLCFKGFNSQLLEAICSCLMHGPHYKSLHLGQLTPSQTAKGSFSLSRLLNSLISHSVVIEVLSHHFSWSDLAVHPMHPMSLYNDMINENIPSPLPILLSKS